jgi:hypothetical protein
LDDWDWFHQVEEEKNYFLRGLTENGFDGIGANFYLRFIMVNFCRINLGVLLFDVPLDCNRPRVEFILFTDHLHLLIPPDYAPVTTTFRYRQALGVRC